MLEINNKPSRKLIIFFGLQNSEKEKSAFFILSSLCNSVKAAQVEWSLYICSCPLLISMICLFTCLSQLLELSTLSLKMRLIPRKEAIASIQVISIYASPEIESYFWKC